MKETLRIGTRGSALALAQTEEFVQRLKTVHGDAVKTEIVVIKTSGDKTQDQNISLTEIGGKGLFIQEFEDALQNHTIDIAVHSMKDVPSILPDAFSIPCLLPRADAADAFFSHKAKTLDDLPAGSIVGTSSPRRQALVLNARPDLSVAVLRGNVDTRLQKLDAGNVDAMILAVAGVTRIGRQPEITTVLDIDDFTPAGGQGAIGAEILSGNTEIATLLQPLHCLETGLCVQAERGFLAEINGSCKTPLGAYAVYDSKTKALQLSTMAARADGTELRRLKDTQNITTQEDAEKLGRRLGKKLKTDLPENFLDL